MTQWHFKKLEPGDENREPLQGEFFAGDSLEEAGKALIREGIQNSQDARQDKSKPTRVRIALRSGKHAIKSSKAKRYFESLTPHIQADGNGLRPTKIPAKQSACDFLVFEDFNSSGLTGDVATWSEPKKGTKNHFYHFFRAEGQTDKDQNQKGSWGVGKHLFWMTSRISTVFGLTIRKSDDKEYLFGKSILKTHRVGPEAHRIGYFGHKDPKTPKFILPGEDKDLIAEFKQTFDLKRSDEPGLSLVVPWPAEEVDWSSLVSSVVTDYFFPILRGELEVELSDSDNDLTLTKSNIKDVIVDHSAKIDEDLESLIELAFWANNCGEDEFITIKMPRNDRAWKWDESLVDDDGRQAIAKQFHDGEGIAIRVPVTVRTIDEKKHKSQFEIFVQRTENQKRRRPTFIRDGLIISDVKSPYVTSAQSLVICEHEHLAKMLRKAENPSHTEWHGSRLKDDYLHGVQTDLRFVVNSVNELLRILLSDDEKGDPSLLVDIFSIPKDAGLPQKKKKKKKKGDEDTEPDTPEIQKHLQKIQVTKKSGGFTITSAAQPAPVPFRVNVKVAYDVRRGNPMKKYSTSDFQLQSRDMKIEVDPPKAVKAAKKGNRLEFEVVNPEFSVTVTGFDENRQIIVDARPEKLAAVEDDE